jgi:hypothetical protein
MTTVIRLLKLIFLSSRQSGLLQTNNSETEFTGEDDYYTKTCIWGTAPLGSGARAVEQSLSRVSEARFLRLINARACIPSRLGRPGTQPRTDEQSLSRATDAARPCARVVDSLFFLKGRRGHSLTGGRQTEGRRRV